MANLKNLEVNDVGSLTLPLGTEANRPTVSPTIQSFTSLGTTTWTAPADVTSVEVLVVAGGGAGGSTLYSGGGGAGGVIYNSAYPVIPGTGYTVTVGAGGAGASDGNRGANGSNSVFDRLTAIGGGGGGGSNSGQRTGGTGGSGGGGAVIGEVGGLGIVGQGTNGGYSGLAQSDESAGGGGGAGTAGGIGYSVGLSAEGNGRGGNGGSGLPFNISGSTVYYGGGGGGGTIRTSLGGIGGVGGGGNGYSNGTAATSGSANTGGGGGGSGWSPATTAGSGGSGIVVLRYFQSSSDPTKQLRFNTNLKTVEEFERGVWTVKNRGENFPEKGLVLHIDPATYVSGSTLYDLSGNGNNGTLNNGAAVIRDNQGVLQFDGTNDYVRIPISSSLNTLQTSCTVSVWFNAAVISANAMIVNNHIQSATSVGPVSGLILNTTDSGTITFKTRINNTCCQTLTAGTYATNSWNHLVATYDGRVKKFYQNGRLIGEQAATGPLNMINDIFLGINADSFRADGSFATQFTGKIGPLKIYNRTFTDEDAIKDYNSQRNRFESTVPTTAGTDIDIVQTGLVLNLDAGNRDSYSGYGSIWTDLARGNQGRLTNTPQWTDRGESSYFNFNGSNQYVFVGSPVPNPVNCTTGISLCAWIYPFANGGNALYQIVGSQYDTGGNRGATLMLDGRTSPAGKLHFQIGNGSQWFAVENPPDAASVPINTWTYVVATWSTGNQGLCYLNGVRDLGIYQNYHNGPISNVAGSEFSIGRQSDFGRYFNGRIACVHVYNRRLSASEIRANYQATRKRYGR